jgi:hypothetical protein
MALLILLILKIALWEEKNDMTKEFEVGDMIVVSIGQHNVNGQIHSITTINSAGDIVYTIGSDGLTISNVPKNKMDYQKTSKE